MISPRIFHCSVAALAVAICVSFTTNIAVAIEPGDYLGEFCWRASFTEFRNKQMPSQIISSQSAEFTISMQASYAGGGIYNLVGYLSDSTQPEWLIPKTARAHLLGDTIYYQMRISSIGINTGATTSGFVDWQATTVPEGLHWTTGGDLNGMLGYSRKTFYYVISAGEVVSYSSAQAFDASDIIPVNPESGVIRNIDCAVLGE